MVVIFIASPFVLLVRRGNLQQSEGEKETGLGDPGRIKMIAVTIAMEDGNTILIWRRRGEFVSKMTFAIANENHDPKISPHFEWNCTLQLQRQWESIAMKTNFKMNVTIKKRGETDNDDCGGYEKPWRWWRKFSTTVVLVAMDADCGYNDVGDDTASSSPSLMTATTMKSMETITVL